MKTWSHHLHKSQAPDRHCNNYPNWLILAVWVTCNAQSFMLITQDFSDQNVTISSCFCESVFHTMNTVRIVCAHSFVIDLKCLLQIMLDLASGVSVVAVFISKRKSCLKLNPSWKTVPISVNHRNQFFLHRQLPLLGKVTFGEMNEIQSSGTFHFVLPKEFLWKCCQLNLRRGIEKKDYV